jgi:hypothetical protein
MKLTPKIYTDPAEKKRDFWRGVGLWFGLNIVMTLCNLGLTTVLDNAAISSNAPFAAYSTISIVVGIIPWLVNIGLLVYFAMTRSQIALGMLAGFGFALFLVICLGIIFAVACFIMLGTQGTSG